MLHWHLYTEMPQRRNPSRPRKAISEFGIRFRQLGPEQGDSSRIGTARTSAPNPAQAAADLLRAGGLLAALAIRCPRSPPRRCRCRVSGRPSIVATSPSAFNGLSCHLEGDSAPWTDGVPRIVRQIVSVAFRYMVSLRQRHISPRH